MKQQNWVSEICGVFSSKTTIDFVKHFQLIATALSKIAVDQCR